MGEITWGRVEIVLTEGRRVHVVCTNLDEAQAVYLLEKAKAAVLGGEGKVSGLTPTGIVPRVAEGRPQR